MKKMSLLSLVWRVFHLSSLAKNSLLVVYLVSERLTASEDLGSFLQIETGKKI